MTKKKFKNITEYLIDRWGEDWRSDNSHGLMSLKTRFMATDDFMAGWLTAMVTMDSNQIDFSDDLASYTKTIVQGCKKFMGV